MDEQAKPNTDLTPGELLKKVRIAANLTLENIAAQLYLKVNVIRNLENDNYPATINLVFMKGYLCSYGRVLNIPRATLLQAFAKLEASKFGSIGVPAVKTTAVEVKAGELLPVEKLTSSARSSLDIASKLYASRAKQIADCGEPKPDMQVRKITAILAGIIIMISFTIWQVTSHSDAPPARQIGKLTEMAASTPTTVIMPPAAATSTVLQQRKEDQLQPISPRPIAKPVPEQANTAVSTVSQPQQHKEDQLPLTSPRPIAKPVPEQANTTALPLTMDFANG